MSENVKTNGLRAWFLAARPKTLTGAAAPVLLGGGCAFHLASGNCNALSLTAFLLCLAFALVMQIDANFVNDYFDWKKGTDRADRLGPERACAQGWIAPQAMRRGILFSTLLGIAIGLPLLLFGGWPMLLVGICCVAACILYTTHLSYLGWGDALVVVFFGLVPVYFTCHCTLGLVRQPLLPLLLGLAMGLATDCLLMVNNYRDVEQDRISGKRTLVVRWGRRTGQRLYLWLGAAAAAIAAATLFYFGLKPLAIVPAMLIYLLLHFATQSQLKQLQGRELNRVLGKTARNIFLFGLLAAISLVL